MHVVSIGFSLPGPEYENCSITNAPALFDYDAALVNPKAVSEQIEAVIDAGEELRTADGRPVVNATTSPAAEGLAELLRARQEEVMRLLARGQLVVVWGYPNVPHPRVAGFTGCDRYFWLPAPSGFSYTYHLLPAEGRTVIVTDDTHPFSRYLETYSGTFAYHAYFREDLPGFATGARVFARSAGGAAVGVELTVGRGRVIFAPPPAEMPVGAQRRALATLLLECIRHALMDASAEPPPLWAASVELPGLEEREAAVAAAAEEAATTRAKLQDAETRLHELARFRSLLWEDGAARLEPLLREAFRLLGFDVTPEEKPAEVSAEGERALLEWDASTEQVEMEGHYRLRKRRETELRKTRQMPSGVLVVSGHRRKEPAERGPQHIEALAVAAESQRYCLMTTEQLLELVRRALAGAPATALQEIRRRILVSEGLFQVEEEAAAEPEATPPAVETAAGLGPREGDRRGD